MNNYIIINKFIRNNIRFSQKTMKSIQFLTFEILYLRPYLWLMELLFIYKLTMEPQLFNITYLYELKLVNE